MWRRVPTEVPEGVRDANKTQHPLNTSALYNSVNMNKRELTLNMKEPRGIELFWQLVPGFDILLDNFRATVMPGWGVTLEIKRASSRYCLGINLWIWKRGPVQRFSCQRRNDRTNVWILFTPWL